MPYFWAWTNELSIILTIIAEVYINVFVLVKKQQQRLHGKPIISHVHPIDAVGAVVGITNL